VTSAEHFAYVLGRIESKLLAIEISDRWLGFHDDARLGAVYSAGPGAFQADDHTALELLRVFAEVPDVAVLNPSWRLHV
jgi:hypothetical protein